MGKLETFPEFINQTLISFKDDGIKGEISALGERITISLVFEQCNTRSGKRLDKWGILEYTIYQEGL